MDHRGPYAGRGRRDADHALRPRGHISVGRRGLFVRLDEAESCPAGDGRCRRCGERGDPGVARRSEEHTSELQSLMRISYAVFCLKKKKTLKHTKRHIEGY